MSACKIKSLAKTSCWRGCGGQAFSYIASRKANSFNLSRKELGNTSQSYICSYLWPTNPALRNLSRKYTYNLTNVRVHKDTHWSIVCNCKILETFWWAILGAELKKLSHTHAVEHDMKRKRKISMTTMEWFPWYTLRWKSKKKKSMLLFI